MQAMLREGNEMQAMLRKVRMLVFAALTSLLAVTVSAQVIDHKAYQERPIQLGTSGGNINDRSKSFCCGGTLGSLLKIGNASYILSNNHVLARTNQGKPGELIIQPGLIDQTPVCYQDTNDAVAALYQFVPISFDKKTTNKVDAAIALPKAGAVASDGSILEIGSPSSRVVDPTPGMLVKKSGRTTGLTYGQVQAVGVTIDVQYQLGCGTGKTVTARFVDQFAVSPSGFSAGGDSGSLIVTADNNNPVGLLFAGSKTLTFANKMSDVIAAFNGISSASLSVQQSAQAGRAGEVELRVEHARRVKERYRDFLEGLPEALGHGVGRSRSNPEEPAIQVYVRKGAEQARRMALPSLEGVPVEIIETGEIYALPGCTPCGVKAIKSCR